MWKFVDFGFGMWKFVDYGMWAEGGGVSCCFWDCLEGTPGEGRCLGVFWVVAC